MKLKKKSSEVAHTGLDCFCGRFGNKAAPEDCVDFWSFFFWRKKNDKVQPSHKAD